MWQKIHNDVQLSKASWFLKFIQLLNRGLGCHILPELYFSPFFELRTVVPQMDHINSLFHNFFSSSSFFLYSSLYHFASLFLEPGFFQAVKQLEIKEN